MVQERVLLFLLRSHEIMKLKYVYSDILIFSKPKTSDPALMTTNPFSPTDIFDMMVFSDESEIFGTVFKLDWSRAPDGDPAQVQFIEIDFRRINSTCKLV